MVVIDDLFSSAIAGDVDAIAMLEMEAEKLDDRYKRSILHTEVKKGNTGHVGLIVRKIANKKNLWAKLDWMNQTALHCAVFHGQPDMVEVLIDGARQFFQDNNVSSFPANDDDPHKPAVSSFQAYIRHVNTDSATALSYGVMFGYLRCVKMLVRADPTDRHTKYQGKSPMYTAAEEGYNDIVKIICTTCKAPSLDGPGGSTALHAAIKHLNQAEEKDTDMIRMIIDAAKRSCTPPYGSFEDLFNQTNESGHTVLELAVIGNQQNVVDLILKKGKGPMYTAAEEGKNDMDGSGGSTALHAPIKHLNQDDLCSAAIAGDVHAIAMLEMEAEKRSTILHTLADIGNTEHVRFIVRNIANKKNLWVKLDGMNQTALHRAVYHRQCDVVEILIDGARQFFQDNNVSSFPANDDPHESVSPDNDEPDESIGSFQAYIRHVNVSSFPANDDPHESVTSFQAYIRHVNRNSDTALSDGVMRGCLRCVKMLVEADPTDRHTLNIQGESPMYTAAKKGYNDIVKAICTTCTAPSLDGPRGSTALHAAIKHLDQVSGRDQHRRDINARAKNLLVHKGPKDGKADASGSGALKEGPRKKVPVNAKASNVARAHSPSKRRATDPDGAPTPKRTKANSPPQSSGNLVAFAPSNSLKLANDLSKSIPLSESDKKVTLVGASQSGVQTMGFLAQSLLWAASQTSQTLALETKLAGLEKDADAANDRATDMQKERDTAKEEAKKARLLARAESKRIKELEIALAEQEKLRNEAEERALDAEAVGYADGIREICENAKKIGLDHKTLISPEGYDPFEGLESTSPEKERPEGNVSKDGHVLPEGEDTGEAQNKEPSGDDRPKDQVSGDQ